MICERHKDIPENVEMADEQWFDHFLHCIPVEERLRVITGIRQTARIGHACWMGNHQGTINSQAQYTAKLLTGIRELLEYAGQSTEGAPDPADIAYQDVVTRLRALIS